MSVLIKDMEFPECCYACTLNLWHTECSYTGHEFHDMFGEDIDPSKERHPDCPLIEVPPHGRLIDADALEYHAEIVRDTEDGHRWLVRAIEEDQILDAPTIIESEGE